jgi:low affinity Fe/Cu permease
MDGKPWAFVIAAACVLIGLFSVGVELTNISISIVTLLMVFVLQNTQNRDSAALHLKLDEVVRVEPEARDHIRGVETRSRRRDTGAQSRRIGDDLGLPGHEGSGRTLPPAVPRSRPSARFVCVRPWNLSLADGPEGRTVQPAEDHGRLPTSARSSTLAHAMDEPRTLGELLAQMEAEAGRDVEAFGPALSKREIERVARLRRVLLGDGGADGQHRGLVDRLVEALEADGPRKVDPWIPLKAALNEELGLPVVPEDQSSAGRSTAA